MTSCSSIEVYGLPERNLFLTISLLSLHYSQTLILYNSSNAKTKFNARSLFNYARHFGNLSNKKPIHPNKRFLKDRNRE